MCCGLRFYHLVITDFQAIVDCVRTAGGGPRSDLYVYKIFLWISMEQVIIALFRFVPCAVTLQISIREKNMHELFCSKFH